MFINKYNQFKHSHPHADESGGIHQSIQGFSLYRYHGRPGDILSSTGPVTCQLIETFRCFTRMLYSKE
ncbi:MAG: hypothetical protein BRD50_00265 [Bacteroidetes bacterium SW_11_45_7]|nr:MAG: hypothetical protein BRD50_00265 [Bacteroidetes bacterium SW_11_45_7]